MLRVALTGNIASGKSTVASVWRRAGARVVEADELARRAVAPGTPALDRIIDEWGPGVVLPSGELDRAALRDVVFRDADARRRLEQIIHPEVQHLRAEEERRAKQDGERIFVADIPLLFEAGLTDEFDLIVLVDSPEELRHQRLVHERQLSPDEARRMIEAQWPAERKRPESDYIIDNVGSIAELEQRARDVWTRIVARDAGRVAE